MKALLKPNTSVLERVGMLHSHIESSGGGASMQSSGVGGLLVRRGVCGGSGVNRTHRAE